jgi:pimeloyl-ACP methyl ester carboxylesterase
VLAGVLLSVSAPASAEPHFTPCNGEIPGECTRVHVPLDRTGGMPGTVSLLVRRTATGGPPQSRVVLALAGGPGQSAVSAFGESYIAVLGPFLDHRDFLAIDVRGSGRSGALRCPELERAARSHRAAAGAECARRLGPRRGFYTTRDTVEDIETVRHKLGLHTLGLFGVSYGTKVALAYAQAHPTHVDRILLDSVLTPEGPDPLYRPSFAALRHVLPALCAHGACRGITRHLYHDVAALAGRLRRHRLRGRVVGADGRARTGTLDEGGLFSVVLDGDELPILRSDLPASVHSALRGDPAALLRLTNPDLASRGSRAGASSGIGFSEALYAATSCEEMPFPWSRTAPLRDRPAQLRHALGAQPASMFAPFGRGVPPRTDFLSVCSRWPVRADPPTLAGGPLPSVPALLLSGEDDIRTPVAQARIALSRLPQGKLLTVRATGHNVTGGEVTRCVRVAIARWARGGAVPSRCPRARPDPLTPVLPRRLRDVRPARGTSGKPGRTLAAVVRTLEDLATRRKRSDREGGLRGGLFRVAGDGAIALVRLSVVEGVAVTGRSRPHRRVLARLRIGGKAAAHGTLALLSDGRLTGRLGGRRVRGRVPTRTARVLREGA